jgi:hypothetical protein
MRGIACAGDQRQLVKFPRYGVRWLLRIEADCRSVDVLRMTLG